MAGLRRELDLRADEVAAEEAARRRRDRLAVDRRLVAVSDTTRLTKADMPENTALPDIRVDPDTFTVSVDGEVWEPEPVRELPMAQRYFLF